MKVSVSLQQIEKVADMLKATRLNPAFLDREFLQFNADRETKLRVYFLSAAICHQTRTLHHPKLNLWGWEYMEYGFLQMLKQKNPILNPGYMSICNIDDVESILKQTFSPDADREKCTLDRIDERVSMLLEICRIVKNDYQSRISNLLDEANGLLLNRGKGLYEILPQFMAFSDPQKKKITFFLKLATDAGVIKIKDPENLIPIMDYHMQRVLLRTGCVEVKDPNLKKDLLSKSILDSDEPIRTYCIGALRLIAEKSRMPLLAMNDIFWPLGRSCCNEMTLCTSGKCSKNPCTLLQTLDLESHTDCLLHYACKGSSDEAYRNLFEPFVKTHYY